MEWKTVGYYSKRAEAESHHAALSAKRKETRIIGRPADWQVQVRVGRFRTT